MERTGTMKRVCAGNGPNARGVCQPGKGFFREQGSAEACRHVAGKPAQPPGAVHRSGRLSPGSRVRRPRVGFRGGLSPRPVPFLGSLPLGRACCGVCVLMSAGHRGCCVCPLPFWPAWFCALTLRRTGNARAHECPGLCFPPVHSQTSGLLETPACSPGRQGPGRLVCSLPATVVPGVDELVLHRRGRVHRLYGPGTLRVETAPKHTTRLLVLDVRR